MQAEGRIYTGPLTKRAAPLAQDRTTNLQVKMAKYATSLDPRGFIPVYEYLINGQSILWDRESGYVYWTGIWKALGREKSEIAKIVDADPLLANVIKKIRGGFLKIQGTWIPFESARSLAIRTCWPIRAELAVIFGPSFAADALDTSHPGFLRPPAAHADPSRCDPRKVKRPRRSPTSSALSLLRNAHLSHFVVAPPIKSFKSVYSSSPVSSQSSQDLTSDLYRTQKDLNDAVMASISLLRLSRDTGTGLPPVIDPPASFAIAGANFRWIDHAYRQVDLN
ncbi:hypothetical protein DSO57_1018931 [Entomophthora muscae]|uniref:Uncharacterized protein n=1 Tax=Entomophthora muscae TaxID=34485 RepID=A0ACC2T4H9_9FUNG|nr:hypothetical protein DSO57_1018931 [Entomophthora muscae]